MTLNELAFELAHQVGRADDPTVIRIARKAVLDWRGALLRQMGSARYIHDQLFQRFCIPMKQVSATECCDVSSTCKVYRTEQTIPFTVNFRNNPNHYVGKVNGTSPYVYLPDMSYLPGVLEQRYGNMVCYYWQIGGYVYTNQKYKKLLVRAVFDNPMVAANLYDCDGNPCFTEDSEFPITTDLAVRVKQSILKNELQSFQNVKEEEIDAEG